MRTLEGFEPMSSWKWPTLTCLPLGLLEALPSEGFVEHPSPKLGKTPPITILESTAKNKPVRTFGRIVLHTYSLI
jgi:hypothetical protein